MLPQGYKRTRRCAGARCVCRYGLRSERSAGWRRADCGAQSAELSFPVRVIRPARYHDRRCRRAGLRDRYKVRVEFAFEFEFWAPRSHGTREPFATTMILLLLVHSIASSTTTTLYCATQTWPTALRARPFFTYVRCSMCGKTTRALEPRERRHLRRSATPYDSSPPGRCKNVILLHVARTKRCWTFPWFSPPAN